MVDFLPHYKKSFRDNVKICVDNLQILQSGNNQEALFEVHRMVHTLKTSSKMMGQQEIAELMELLEIYFKKIRNENGTLESSVINILLPSIRAIAQKVEALDEHSEQLVSLDISQETEAIKKGLHL